MPRYVLLSFLFMGWAFYELSGGSDFVPKSKSVQETAQAVVIPAAQPGTRAKLEQSRRERAAKTVFPATAKRSVVKLVNDAPVTASAISADQTASTDKTELRLAFLKLEDDPAQEVTAVVRNPPTPVASSEPPPDTAQALVLPVARAADLREVIGARVNMRSGPGTSHEVLARLKRGQSVEVLENGGSGWLRLRTLPEDQVGWIAERLVSKAN